MSTSRESTPSYPHSPHAFLTGVTSPYGCCEQVIETVLSRLYVYPDAIYKWYRPVVAYYGDLLEPAQRRRFFEHDFAWNATVSPSVYLALIGIRYDPDGHSFSEVPAESAEDFLIKMRPVTKASTLSELLRDAAASPVHIEQAVSALLAAQRGLHERFIAELSDVRGRGLSDLYAENISDLTNQLLRAHEFVPQADARIATHRLRSAVSESAYFRGFPAGHLTVALDCHTDNILFGEGGDLVVIDSMFPKRNWRIMDELHTAARVAANAAVLGGPEQRMHVYRAYSAMGGTYVEEAALAHESRTALMQWSRRHLLGEHDLAERFRLYADALLSELGA